MNRTIKNAAVLVSGFVLLSFGVVVVNQTAGVVSLAGEVHPLLGKATLVGLVGSYAALIGVPVVLFVRLPRSLDPPRAEDDPAFPDHLDNLRRRLAGNPLVTEADLASRAGLDRAIAQLDARADEIVRSTASVVFLSTAVSQNGKFDAMIVLAAQSRMVWQVAHLYSQRPTAKDMTRLYANVAATAFAAGAIEEVDLNEQIQPILGSTVGSMAGAIPGFQVATMLLVNSVMSGSANAYLTLRVGLIAKKYCGAVVLQPRPAIRRAASAEAARMLGGIVAAGTAKISGAVWGAVREKGTQTFDGVKGRVVTTYDSVKGNVTAKVTTVSESARGAGDRVFRRFQRGPGRPGAEPTG
ncbi:DUF697 domain-containing protein [Tautonia plasticadhaerens]|uniref:DUF697 domain-containing protein n=1 Tax=Tautonia plasticadhaerens TaxID=2527974 RepID=A0A518H3H9_9BACT|nr:DUF697 domain-containing protein [Tautonia plasticadhaerens]QDV35401.1 hypothetical protein ElP_33040 [Tautonia plasticadhaerens]